MRLAPRPGFSAAPDAARSFPPDENAALLREFAASGSESAFTAFVRRNVDLVYSAAVRRCGGDTHQAEEIAQAVFANVAGQAEHLARHPALCAWLYTATRNAALNARLADRRRRHRETEAMIQSLEHPDQGADWREVRTLLDAAMDELGETDRTAVLLRYFERCSFAEIGGRINSSENTARMRTERALGKLREVLARHGVKSTSAALGAALTAHAVTRAPAHLVGTAVAHALGHPVSASALVSRTRIGASSTLRLAGIGCAVLVTGVVLLRLLAPGAGAGDGADAARGARMPASAIPATPEKNGTAAVETAAGSSVPLPSRYASRAIAGSTADAEAILRRMAQAYAASSSYEDSGEIWITTRNRPAPTRPAITFRTQFSRPGRLRFEALLQNGPGARSSALLVADGRRAVSRVAYGRHGWANEGSITGGITEVATPTSGGSFHIPRLLVGELFMPIYFSPAALERPLLLAPEMADNTACHVVNGRHPNGTSCTLWIGEADYLIRKIVTEGPVSIVASRNRPWSASRADAPVAVEERHWNVRVNEPVAPEAFIVPEEPAALR